MRLFFSFLSITILILVPLFARKLTLFKQQTKRWWVSFSGGVALSYIFVHILPELAVHQKMLGQNFREQMLLIADFYVYLVALMSFILFFGLERFVLYFKKQSKRISHDRKDKIFWVHLSITSLHNVLIGYLLCQIDPINGALALSTFAFALHFFAIDYNLSSHHQYTYKFYGKWMLASGIALGWVMGQIVHVTGEIEAILFAFMAGTVTVNAIKDEIPSERGGRFAPFCFGSVVYALMQLASFSLGKASNYSW